jgi:hypothetical protein
MTKQKDENNLSNPITLAPFDTPEGEMERAFLTETRSPGNPKYDPKIDLEAMRDMRQVIENRLKAPESYAAKDRKDQIDILKAPGQFPEFKHYPASIPSYVQIDVSRANNATDPQHTAYREHVQHAITAATEDVTTPRASLPEATGWVRNPGIGKAKPPGANFYPLGDVGGNSFFGTKPASSAVELARHHAAQARAQARAKPVPAHMKVPHLLIQMHRAGHGVSPAFRPPAAGHAASGGDHAGANASVRMQVCERKFRAATAGPCTCGKPFIVAAPCRRYRRSCLRAGRAAGR